MPKLTPEEAASCYFQIYRCLGNTASGNDYRCHPDLEPGGYDVGFGMIMLNQNPMSFEEAKEYQRLAQFWVARALKLDRADDHDSRGPRPQNFAAMREVDVYGGRDAWIAGEAFLEKRNKGKEPKDRQYLYKGTVRCSYGILVYVRKGPSDLRRKFIEAPPVLVIPPKGEVYQLEEAATLEEALQKFGALHPEVPVIFDSTLVDC